LASRPPDVDKETQAYLPDFCAAGAIFVVVLVSALIAIVLTLASHTTPGTFLTELAKMSLFILWLGLLGAAILCQIRPWVEKFGQTQAFVIAFVLLELLSLVLAEIAFQLTGIFGEAVIINDTHSGFILRTFAISSIIIALAMRYLYISSEWRRSIVLEAQARISALQALIRPHFLFNSMNTIASLTRSDPFEDVKWGKISPEKLPLAIFVKWTKRPCGVKGIAEGVNIKASTKPACDRIKFTVPSTRRLLIPETCCKLQTEGEFIRNEIRIASCCSQPLHLVGNGLPLIIEVANGVIIACLFATRGEAEGVLLLEADVVEKNIKPIGICVLVLVKKSFI